MPTTGMYSNFEYIRSVRIVTGSVGTTRGIAGAAIEVSVTSLRGRNASTNKTKRIALSLQQLWYSMNFSTIVAVSRRELGPYAESTKVAVRRLPNEE
eukprot:4756385-Pleurochrysis_carterae.AAC.1